MNQIVNSFEDYLDEYEKNWVLSGTILVAQDGEILLKKAYGYADLEHRVPNTIDTKFRIWSLSKSFTAMAIMILYEQKLLKLDEDINKFIPEFADKEISIMNLLNHTSGLVNYTSLPGYHFRLNKLELSHQDIINLLKDKPLQFKPGSSFFYTNSAYYLLGMIIEKISGLTYEEFLTHNILEPLGMENTGIFHHRKVIQNMSSGYHSNWEDFIKCEYLNMSGNFAAGSMYSTIDDLFAWDQALYTETLISKAALDLVFKPSFNYGFGWFIDERFNRKRIHHSGAYRGHRSDMQRYPDDKVTTIMLTNYDFVPILKLTDRLTGLVFGEKAAVPTKPRMYPLKANIYEKYMGTYEGDGDDCKAVVDRKGEQLFFVFNEEAYIPFYPVSETKFHHTWYEWSCEFTFDDRGDVSFLGMKKTK